MSTKSYYSRNPLDMLSSIYSIIGIHLMEDIDMPPDVLELCDKDEMQKVINSHSGCENDEEPEGLPE
jgi:hypothetical protein